MDTVSTIAAVRARVQQWRRERQRVAFVPTMGNLHAGHISLIELARQRGDRFVASLFVNPMQFGPNEDFAHYPRTPDQDSAMLAAAGCSLVFMPDVAEIYPQSVTSSTQVAVPRLSTILCGEFRPGHFEGVATVVTKLLNIVAPDIAVFGEKDFQQLTVIRHLVADLCLPVEIIGAPTVREPDGLAMSSRNQYLTAEERRLAPRIYEALTQALHRLERGERDYGDIERAGAGTLQSAGFKPDYFVVRDAADLDIPRDESQRLVVLTAARLGKARLIDNVCLPKQTESIIG